LAYAILLVLAAVDAAGYSVIAPVVPELAQSTSASPAVIGALIASFPVGMGLGFAVAGEGVKRRGPRLVIVSALAVIVLGCAGFVFGTGLATFFLARFVMGVGSGGPRRERGEKFRAYGSENAPSLPLQTEAPQLRLLARFSLHLLPIAALPPSAIAMREQHQRCPWC